MNILNINTASATAVTLTGPHTPEEVLDKFMDVEPLVPGQVTHIDLHTVFIRNPRELEPVLAEIRQQTDLGNAYYSKVMYHDGEKWRDYEEEYCLAPNERVTRWKYIEDIWDEV